MTLLLLSDQSCQQIWCELIAGNKKEGAQYNINLFGMEEQWKILLENNNYYVSNLGRFKNSRNKILKLNKNVRGYYYCNISTKGVITKVKIHKLVAKYFVPNLNNKDTVNHIDGNKLNNLYTNLEWLTRKENIQHYYKNRTKLIQSI